VFTAFAAATKNPDVKAVAERVALREAEHKVSFAKRINELGYSVRDRDDPGLEARIAMVSSKKLTDQEKLAKLGYSVHRDGPDVFANFFEDTTIDIQTGELLGRYIAEERDSARRLYACHDALAAMSTKKSGGAKSTTKKGSRSKKG